MTWVRFDDRTATHPKIRSLNDTQFRVWFRMLLVCSQHNDPSVDQHVISEVKGLTLKGVEKFHDAGLLDHTPHGYTIHNWSDYRPKDPTAADRMRKHREHDRNEHRNGTVTRARPSRPVPSRDALGTSTESISEGRETEASYGYSEEGELSHLAPPDFLLDQLLERNEP